MWTYVQRTGELFHNGEAVAIGYSGHEAGVNNPDLQNVPNVGPLPCGTFVFGPPHDSPKTGPFSLSITPIGSTNTFGRGGFACHGDDKEHPGMKLASHGCLIYPRAIREQIVDSQDAQLEVVAERADVNNAPAAQEQP